MSEAPERAEIRSIPPKSVVCTLMLVLAMLVSACSSSDQAGESRSGDTETRAPASAPSVADSAPSEVDGSAQSGDASAGNDADSDADNDADGDQVVGTPAVLSEADFAEVVSMRAGEPVEDVAGDVITAYGVHRLPDDVLARLNDRDLFGNTEDAFASELSPAIIDLGMCAAGGDGAASAVEFSLFGSDFDVYDERPTVFLNHSIAHRGFTLPDPGECSRGWLLVLHDASSPTAVRYVVSKPTSDGEVERYLYQWNVPFDDVLDRELGEEDGRDQLVIGQTVTFNDGPLTDTSVDFKGWAEIVGGDTPLPETRLVGVLAEVCTATEDWPELGLGIEGWNLLGPVDPADRLGAEPFAPLAGSCFEDWIEFAVPFGAEPTSFFVADGIDPVNGFAEWTLADAAIAPPDPPS